MTSERSRPAPFELDTRRVRRSFEMASATYDEAAVLQDQVRARMLERLDLVRLNPGRILDAGSGTGLGAAALARRYRGGKVIALDLAHGMLLAGRARQRLWRRWGMVCGDVAALPLASGSVDMIFCNLVLQWCPDLDLALGEFRRVLAPGGLLMFTTFGPDTLHELRAAWSKADGYNHVNAFLDMHDVGDALLRARLAEPVMDVEHFVVDYDNPRDLMRDLKAIGARNATAGRARGLTGPRRLRAMEAAYESFRRDGRLPATYEVVYGHAWAPEPRSDGSDNSIAIPVDSIGRRRGPKR
ncbi:MAG: malonyl-[acyl-carrier protein] O-methyltransferase BioC [Chromatiales bacterium]|jgi:malonyl-CoA O-methyltransferase|nr:MAG: malonyl-[acyl-carrier protein] O-methyltransferase BioC [Chromatiales bacterium]